MKSKKLIRVIDSVAILAALFLGVNFAQAAPRPVTIGYVGGLTGPLASTSIAAKIVYQYVVDQVNKEGGIKSMGGAKLKLIVSDDESDTKKAATEVEKMLTLYKPQAMLSTGGSFTTKAVLPIVLRHKVPMVGMEYSDELFKMNNPFWFGVMPKVSINAKEMADLFITTGEKTGHPVKRVAILCQDGSFGEMASDTWGKYFRSKGVKVVANEIYPTGKVADFSDTIARFKALKADALMCTTTPSEAAMIVRAMKATNFNPLGYAFSCTCIDTPDFMNLGNDGDFAYGVPVFSVKEMGDKIKGAAAFLRNFYSVVKGERERKICTPKIVLERVLTIAPVIHAIENAKSYDPVVVRDAIAKLDLHTGDRFVYWPDGIKFDKTGWNVRSKTIGGQYQNMQLKILFPKSMVSPGDKPVWPMPTWKQR